MGVIDSYKVKDNIKQELAGQEKSTQSNSLTMEKFNKINTGMTYSQVVSIIGFEGKLFSEAGTLKVYTWTKSNKVISISFNNNKVSAKSQIGL